jgi:hypothetical protein
MAVSLARLGRFIRSIFAPTVAIFSFSCLLTFIFVLYQPTPGPGAIQRLGWQSWDVISDTTRRPAAAGSLGEDLEDVNIPGGGLSDEGVDWWNVTSPDDAPTYDPASLPLDVWDPLMPHDTGCKSPRLYYVENSYQTVSYLVSEIEVTQCFFDPWFMPSIAADLCAPATTKEQDAKKGKWVQVGRNLNVQGFSFLVSLSTLCGYGFGSSVNRTFTTVGPADWMSHS